MTTPQAEIGLLRLTSTGDLCIVPWAQSGSQSDAHATPVPVAETWPHLAQTSLSIPALPSCARATLCGRTCLSDARPAGNRYTAADATGDGLAELLVGVFEAEECSEEEREGLECIASLAADVAVDAE